MGIEAALIGMGMSAAAAGTAATAITAAGVGMAASKILTPKLPKAVASIVTPPPQASKAADRTTIAAGNASMAGMGGAFSGNSGTFLTGTGGIDAKSLTLGRSTLLGQ